MLTRRASLALIATLTLALTAALAAFAPAHAAEEDTVTISGRVIDSNGKPIEGYVQFNYRNEGPGYTEHGKTHFNNGEFSWEVPGNRTYIFYADDFGLAAAEYYDDASTEAEAEHVTVTTGAVELEEIVLTAPAAIHGRVVDSAGAEIDGTVTAYDGNGNQVEQSEIVDGEYAVVVAKGSYRLGFTDASRRSMPAFHGDDCASLSCAETVAVDGEPVGLDPVVLEALPLVRATVTGPGGNRIAGDVQVYAEDTPGSGTYDSSPDDSFAFDSGQDDVVAALPEGSYKLRFVPHDSDIRDEFYDDAPDLESAEAVTVGPDGATLDPVTLSTGPVVRVTVTGPGGTRLDAGDYEVLSDDGGFVASGSFDRSDVEIPLHEPGTYLFRFSGCDGSLCFAPEYYLDAASIGEAHPVEVPAAGVVLQPVELDPGAGVSGSVADAQGNPLEDTQVTVWERTGGLYTQVEQLYTGRDGEFAVNLDPGTYGLQFRSDDSRHAPEYYDDASSLAGGTPVTVAEAHVRLAPVVMDTGASIVGKVTDPDGRPLEGIDVVARAVDSSGVARSATTAADGTYRLTPMTPGSYTVLASDPFGHYELRYVAPGGSTSQGELAERVSLTKGQSVTGKDVVLPPAPPGLPTGTDVAGVVTDDAGRPAPGVSVRAVPVEEGASGHGGEWTVTNRAGEFSFRSLDRVDPRDYKLEFEPSGPIVDGEWVGVMPGWYGGPTFARATSVRVTRGGAVQELSVRLPRYGGVAGEVTPEAGGSRRGLVTLFDARGDEVGGGQVRSDGTFRFGFVAPGTYYLRAGVGDHLPAWYADGYSLATATPVVVRSGAFTSGLDLTVPKGLRSHGRPAISGAPRVGAVLSATAGVWNLPGTEHEYEWRRGTAVVGTGPTYHLTAADAGNALTVSVTARRDDLTATAESTATAPVRHAATVGVTALAQKKRVVRLTVSLAAGTTSPGGTLTVRDGATVVHTGPAAAGATTVTLRKQKPGRHTYTVAYSGSATAEPASASTQAKVKKAKKGKKKGGKSKR